MKATAKKQVTDIKLNMLRTTVIALCAFFLIIAYIFRAYFFSQLIIYLFLLYETKDEIRYGFEALCNFSPNTESAIFISALASLLHGIALLGSKNSFFIPATALALLRIGKIIEENSFKKIGGHHSIADKIAAFLIPLSLVIMIAAVIVNLFFGRPATEVITRAFLSPVLITPCAVAVFTPLFSLRAAIFAKKSGCIFLNSSAPESVGKVKEIITEKRGSLIEECYSLYDVYSTDGDKIRLLSIAAAIESHFSHPFASVITNAAINVDASTPHADGFLQISGKGVSARIGENKYFLGNKKLMKDKHIDIPEVLLSVDFGTSTPIYIAENGCFLGVLLLSSKMSYKASNALKSIRSLGVRRALLADDQSDEVKKHFDILLFPKEKVLQEFKKGVRIKAMTVSDRQFANADVVASTSHDCATYADVQIDSLNSIVCALAICRRMLACLKAALVLSMLIATAFAILAVFDVFFAPLITSVFASLPLLFWFGIKGEIHIETVLPEDDAMFGKVNFTMNIEGMSCTHCSARVKTALESLRGVSADVSLEEKVARIKCPASTSADTLAKAVTDVGFKVVSTERV